MVAVQNFSRKKINQQLRAPVIKAHVVLGLITKKCEGKGICAIILDPPLERLNNCNQVVVTIGLKKDDYLVFNFFKDSLKACTEEKHFNSNKFKIEESFTIPTEVQQVLKIKKTTILPGEYRIIDQAKSYQIIFNT